MPSEEDYRKLLAYIEAFNKERKTQPPIIEWGDPIDHLRRFVQLNFLQNSFLEIKSDGKLSISGYLPLRLGNLRRHKLKEYWEAGIGKGDLMIDISQIETRFGG